MNVTPSYKVSMTIAAIYAIVLFVPTIDVLAMRSINLRGMHILYNLAVFIFSACYTLSDSVTEVYGKKVSYYLAISSYVVVVLFSFLNNFLVSISINYKLYSFLFQPSLTLTILGPIGYFTTSFINIKLLSKLKAKMLGRHFIFRSFICSGISENR